MNKIAVVINQVRLHHWIKNLLIFAPLFFGGGLIAPDLLQNTVIAFFTFSLSSSLIYIFNDIKDLEEDKLHPRKRHRPLASGRLNLREAILLQIFLLLGIINGLLYLNIPNFTMVLLLYIWGNIFYNLLGKNMPVWDLFLISIFYLLRIYAGSAVTAIEPSGWLLLTIFFSALLLISGKRYSEKKIAGPRKVLHHYPEAFLQHMITLSAAISITAYGLYALNNFTDSLLIIFDALIFSLVVVKFAYLSFNSKISETPELIFFKQSDLILLIAIFMAVNGVNIYLT